MGRLFCYGRLSDCLPESTGERIFLFDIANKVREVDGVKYAMANVMKDHNGLDTLAIHLVLEENVTDQYTILSSIDKLLHDYLANRISVSEYKCHEVHFRPSPTTAKIDRKSYLHEKDGYYLPRDGRLINVQFS